MNQQITFEEFRDYIEQIKKNDEYISKLADLNVNVFENLTTDSLAVNLLEKLTNDESEWISWWIWEKDFGTNEKLKVYDKNNNEIPSTTIKDLWDIITTKN